MNLWCLNTIINNLSPQKGMLAMSFWSEGNFSTFYSMISKNFICACEFLKMGNEFIFQWSLQWMVCMFVYVWSIWWPSLTSLSKDYPRLLKNHQNHNHRKLVGNIIQILDVGPRDVGITHWRCFIGNSFCSESKSELQSVLFLGAFCPQYYIVVYIVMCLAQSALDLVKVGLVKAPSL